MSSDKMKYFFGNENVNLAGSFANLPLVDSSPTTPAVAG
jgi:hypothetical protein